MNLETTLSWFPVSVREAVRRRPLLAKLAGNVGWLVFERVFLLMIGLFTNIWFVKYLGPDAFGSYSYAVSLATLFGAVASMGTEPIIVRDLARDPASEGVILGTALRVRAVVAAASWIAAIVTVHALQADTLSRALVAILGANAVCTSIGVFEFWFQARVAARPLVLGRIAVTLASQAARVLMILAAARLTSFAWLFVATGAAMSGMAYVLFRHIRGKGVRLMFNGQRARAFLRDSWPLAISGIAITVYVKIDQVMLGQVSKHETGLYAAAATLSELWYFIPVAIATTVFPIILTSVTAESSERARRHQRFYDAMVAISFAIACVTTLVATRLVAILYGPAYAAAAGMLVVHVWSLPFVSLGVARSQFLVADNMVVFAMLAALLGAVSNVTLNLFLIPRYGGLGAAWATLISYAVAGYGSSALSRRVWIHFTMQTRALMVLLRPAVLAGYRSER
jgi:PST family polysaccharide transporter